MLLNIFNVLNGDAIYRLEVRNLLNPSCLELSIVPVGFDGVLLVSIKQMEQFDFKLFSRN